MIGCDITGGLGNQFFRYAFARKLQENRIHAGINDELFINGYGVDTHGSTGSLFDFNLAPHNKVHSKRMVMEYGSNVQRTLYSLYALYGRTPFSHNNLLREKAHSLLGKYGIVLSDNPDHEKLYLPQNSVNRVFTHGSFENPSFFQGIEENLKCEFTPPQEISK